MFSLDRSIAWLWVVGAACAALAFATSCAPMPVQQVDKDKFYKRDMLLNVDGIEREGVMVVPSAAVHQFDVTLKGKADLFTLDSCHREISRENAGQGGLFGDRKRVTLDYRPVIGLEDTGSCVVRLGGYERTGGRHSWALIDFEDPKTTLPAKVKCNGEQFETNGVAVCQSKEGMIQEIGFQVEVNVVASPECPMPIPDDRKTFQFKIAPRECVYNFLEIAPKEKRREHRLTTLGYSEILIRGD